MNYEDLYNKDKEYLAELSLKETEALAKVLPHVKLDIPNTVIGAGTSASGGS